MQLGGCRPTDPPPYLGWLLPQRPPAGGCCPAWRGLLTLTRPGASNQMRWAQAFWSKCGSNSAFYNGQMRGVESLHEHVTAFVHVLSAFDPKAAKYSPSLCSPSFSALRPALSHQQPSQAWRPRQRRSSSSGSGALRMWRCGAGAQLPVISCRNEAVTTQPPPHRAGVPACSPGGQPGVPPVGRRA